MSTTELMQMGRRDIKETDAALLRSERLVNDTIGIGVQTAETLDHQTKQLEKVGAGAALLLEAWRHLMCIIWEYTHWTLQRGRGVPWCCSCQALVLQSLIRMNMLTALACLQVIDDLEEIHFSMKKARQVIRDMARGLATDK